MFFRQTLNEIIEEMGFEDEKELHKLVATVDLSTPDKVTLFKDWQFNDGTKAGLLKLLKNTEERRES